MVSTGTVLTVSSFDLALEWICSNPWQTCEASPQFRTVLMLHMSATDLNWNVLAVDLMFLSGFGLVPSLVMDYVMVISEFDGVLRDTICDM
jgi:hypothetical protein